MVGIRPRTKFKLAVKDRRCAKCGAKVNNQRVRCKKCSNELDRPIKNRKKARKSRTTTRNKTRAKLG